MAITAKVKVHYFSVAITLNIGAPFEVAATLASVVLARVRELGHHSAEAEVHGEHALTYIVISMLNPFYGLEETAAQIDKATKAALSQSRF